MRIAADFRGIARDALRGKWKIAVLAGLVASLLGVIEGMGPQVNFNFEGENFDATLKYAGQTIFSTGGNAAHSGLLGFLIGSIVYVILGGLVLAAVYFIFSSIISLGYAKFNLKLVDRLEVSFDDLFAYFSHWKVAAAAKFLKMMFIVFGMILFVIPGILAIYNYSMTDYILAENPEITANEALRRSKEMMFGNRWRLFCLQFSFIGWQILASFTFGIGTLWVNPYMQAANAAFYREVSGTEIIQNRLEVTGED